MLHNGVIITGCVEPPDEVDVEPDAADGEGPVVAVVPAEDDVCDDAG
jgi:hypothetical protein